MTRTNTQSGGGGGEVTSVNGQTGGVIVNLQSVLDEGNTANNQFIELTQESGADPAAHYRANGYADQWIEMGVDDNHHGFPYIDVSIGGSIGTMSWDHITDTRQWQQPDADGTYVISINGNPADEFGNIDVSAGAIEIGSPVVFANPLSVLFVDPDGNLGQDDNFYFDVDNQQLVLPNGTAANPAIRFQDDVNSGIWLAGSNLLKLTAGGTDLVTITAQGISVGDDPTSAFYPIEVRQSMNAPVSIHVKNAGAGDGTVLEATFSMASDYALDVAAEMFLNGKNNPNYGGINSLNIYNYIPGSRIGFGIEVTEVFGIDETGASVIGDIHGTGVISANELAIADGNVDAYVTGGSVFIDVGNGGTPIPGIINIFDGSGNINILLDGTNGNLRMNGAFMPGGLSGTSGNILQSTGSGTAPVWAAAPTGTVTSVSGTTNRITSTGDATPILNISATFEGLLGKVASPLSQFAATTSAQLAGIISDETGMGALVFAVSPALTGTPTAPTATAGTNTTQIATTAFVTGSIPIAGSFSGVGTATTTFTVTIGSTMANTTYKVNATPTNLLAAAVFYITNKTTTTFDVVYLAGLTGTVTFDWAVNK